MTERNDIKSFNKNEKAERSISEGPEKGCIV